MMLSGLAINSLLARILSPSELGTYFIILSFVSVAANFAIFGLNQTVVRLVAENIGTGHPENARHSVRLSLRIAGVSVLIVVFVILLGGGGWISKHIFHSFEMEKLIGLITLWIAVLTFQNLLAEIFRGFHDIRYATLFGGVSSSLLSLLMLIALWMLDRNSSLYKVAILAFVASACSVLLAFYFLNKKLTDLPDKTGQITVRDILTISYPLWITTLVLFLLTQSDIWIIGAFLSQQEVAMYGAATRVMALVAIPLMLVNSVTPPIIAQLFSQNEIAKLERILRTLASISMPFALFMVVIFFFWGDIILTLIFGSFYQNSALVLLTLSFGQVANVGSGSCGMVLMLTGYQKTMMVITTIVGFLTVLFTLLVVQKYGIMGVAMTASLGMVLQNIFMVLYVKIKTGIWTHTYFMPFRTRTSIKLS